MFLSVDLLPLSLASLGFLSSTIGFEIGLKKVREASLGSRFVDFEIPHTIGTSDKEKSIHGTTMSMLTISLFLFHPSIIYRG